VFGLGYGDTKRYLFDSFDLVTVLGNPSDSSPRKINHTQSHPFCSVAYLLFVSKIERTFFCSFMRSVNFCRIEFGFFALHASGLVACNRPIFILQGFIVVVCIQ
jgi:hypothetical protein